MAPTVAFRTIGISRRLAPAIASLAFALLVLAGPAAPVANAACPCSLWDDATVPTGVADSDPGPVELGVKIVPSVDGFITGVRFYKAEANTGTHVGSLWSSAGTQLASVTFAGETASGWQRADFQSPVPVTANTTYVASYHAPQGNYSFDSGYFAASTSNGPLTAPASGDSGGNGVFSYSPGSAFPSSSFNATNYWVDVVFVEPDTTAPTVTAVSPAEGATAVDVAVHPTATFSEAMNAATITSSTVALSGPGGAVAASVDYDPVTRVATLTPTSALATSTTYTVAVKGGAGGVADTAGNVLATDRTWSFTTAAPPGPDTTPPTIVAKTPAAGATGVARNVAPTVTFSEAMDPATITTTTVQLSGPSGSVPATVAYDAAARRATLTPTGALADSATYTLTVKGRQKGVADLAGNTLASHESWSFATVDTTPPSISAISVSSTPSGVATVSWTTNEPSSTRVDYGTTTSLGQNVSNASQVTAHSIQITGLTSGTTYRYRVTSVDASGNSATSPAPAAAPASFTVAVVRSPSGTVITDGSLRSGSHTALAAQDSSYFRVNSNNPPLGLGSSNSSWYGRFTGVPKPLTSLKVTYAGFNSRSCSQVVQVYRWTTGAWIQIDSRTVSTTEIKVTDLAPSGAASDYVSAGGEVRVRVACSAGSSFYASANLLQITTAS